MRPRPPLFQGTRGGHAHVTTLSTMDAPDLLGHAQYRLWHAMPVHVFDFGVVRRPQNQGGIRTPCGHTKLASAMDAGAVAVELLHFFGGWALI